MYSYRCIAEACSDRAEGQGSTVYGRTPMLQTPGWWSRTDRAGRMGQQMRYRTSEEVMDAVCTVRRTGGKAEGFLGFRETGWYSRLRYLGVGRRPPSRFVGWIKVINKIRCCQRRPGEQVERWWPKQSRTIDPSSEGENGRRRPWHAARAAHWRLGPLVLMAPSRPVLAHPRALKQRPSSPKGGLA